MSDYVAPVKEMQFVLNELVGLSAVCELPRFSDTSEDLVSTILDEAGKFAKGVLAPLNTAGDLNGAVCDDNAVQEADGFA